MDDTVPEEALSDAERFGIQISAKDFAGSAEFELWAEHLPAFSAFLAVSGQWRTAPLGFGFRYLGLDYGAVEVGLRRAGIDLDAAGWDEFRQIEGAAASELNREAT